MSKQELELQKDLEERRRENALMSFCLRALSTIKTDLKSRDILGVSMEILEYVDSLKDYIDGLKFDLQQWKEQCAYLEGNLADIAKAVENQPEVKP